MPILELSPLEAACFFSIVRKILCIFHREKYDEVPVKSLQHVLIQVLQKHSCTSSASIVASKLNDTAIERSNVISANTAIVISVARQNAEQEN